MHTAATSFLYRLIVYSLVITGIGLGTYFFTPVTFELFTFLLLQFCVCAITAFTYVTLTKTDIHKQPQKFITRYMAMTTLKLFVYLGGLVGYVVVSKYVLHEQKSYATFIVIFFIIYLLYTVFEVPSIMKFLKQNDDTKS